MLSRLKPSIIQEELLETAKVIERDGWCQGLLWDDKDKVCLIGALMRARVSADTLDAVGKKVGTLAKWNDCPGRTMDEVISMLQTLAYAH